MVSAYKRIFIRRRKRMVKHCQNKVPESKNRSIGPNRLIIIVFLSMLLGVVAAGFSPVHAELDLADTPMLALVDSPPANIMVVLDDSGSMTYEILITGQTNGEYPSPNDTTGATGFCYIFDYMGDRAYRWDDNDDRWEGNNYRYMREQYRTYWRSQYFGDNFMYYNPAVEYQPWPNGASTFPAADMENPKPHPTKSGVTALDLDGKSFTVKRKIDPVTEIDFDVKHAHFFNKSESGDIFLIVIDGDARAIKYYEVIESEGTGYAERVTKVEKVSASSLPDGIAVKNDYDKERQNFANWFTYHRRRDYVAKAALAKVIKNLEGVRVGILAINGTIIVPLQPVKAKINGVRLDQTNALLNALYTIDSSLGGTPLRKGLYDVGRYYQTNSQNLRDTVGLLPPYFSQDQGGACQQSFAIVMTDGYYTLGDTSSLNVGNADGPLTDNAEYESNKTAFDRKALRDDLDETLADVAMYFYENDLSPEVNGTGLSDQVPTFGFDVAAHQHMVTYGVAFGVDGSFNPADYLTGINQIYNDEDFTIPWPTAIGSRARETIDDLWHATLNGRGQYYSAANPQELTASLLEATETISEQLSGSASSITTNGNQLYEEIGQNTLLFQSRYSNENDNKDWVGDVKAYGFNSTTGRLDTDSYAWSAAEQLNEKAWGARNIATYNPDQRAGISFDYDKLTNAQKRLLGGDGASGSTAETTAQARVEYLKGNDIKENDIGGFRRRSSKLGDIVHSEPVHENNVIYVGANDGMLHAFSNQTFETISSTNPAPGDELFAYIPNLVFPNLIELTNPEYNHKYFVDLTPTIVKGMGLLKNKYPSDPDGLHTILVGGLRKGGRGYFALDISDPFTMTNADAVAQKVLWEFPVETDVDMGYSYSKPVVVRSYAANHPWVVIFGNGYNSPSENAVLYILDPTEEPDNNLLIRKFDLGGTPDNGLSSPTPVDVNGDNVVDYVYAGDLKGNLWKFDLTADDSDDWEVAYYNNQGTAEPLFRATGPNDTIQPITTKPEVTLHPEFGYYVFFGTGKYLVNNDYADSSVQSVYGIWDFGDDADNSEYLGTLQRDNGQMLSHMDHKVSLVEQEARDFAYALPNGQVVSVRTLTQKEPQWIYKNDPPGGNPNPSNSEANNAGWYFDLPARERVDQDVLLREDKLIVIGWMPDADQCAPGGGNSMFMELEAETGGNLSLVQLDVTGGGVLNEFDRVQDPNTAELTPPSGLLFRGKLQNPAILRINPAFRLLALDDNDGLDTLTLGSTGCGEEKYLSTSTGQIRIVCERAVSLGMGYWKEVERDEEELDE
jgi:type IV pilus assembly protein PilY1